MERIFQKAFSYMQRCLGGQETLTDIVWSFIPPLRYFALTREKYNVYTCFIIMANDESECYERLYRKEPTLCYALITDADLSDYFFDPARRLRLFPPFTLQEFQEESFKRGYYWRKWDEEQYDPYFNFLITFSTW